MRKYFILSLLFVLAVGLSAPRAFAQTSGTVKGVCTDTDGKPIVGAEVEWMSVETGHKYTLKTNSKGEYFSLGVSPGKYTVTLRKDGKDIFHYNGVPIELGEFTQDFDLKRELAAQAQGQGMTAEQMKAKQEAAAKAESEKKTIGTLNDKLSAARTAMAAKDYETALTTLNDANQIDSNRDTIWFELGNANLGSAGTQTDPEEKKKRYETASTDFQKAIDLRTNSETAQKDPKNASVMAAYYNNLAQVYSKSNKVDDAVANYNKAAQLDPTHAGGYLFNIGAVYTNAGKVDDAIVAFDKVIAADPTKAAAYYWKGVNLIGKETIGKDGKVVAPEGTAEAFQKYLELEPTGTFAQPAKDMLTSIGAKIETGFGTKKKKQ
jgi:tetratricopeptide (TPR) repeat protein